MDSAPALRTTGADYRCLFGFPVFVKSDSFYVNLGSTFVVLTQIWT